MAFAKVRDAETKKLVADKTSVVYNSRSQCPGSPRRRTAISSAPGQRSSGSSTASRSRPTSPSGIVNDPNDWSREVSDPRYIIDLLARIVTVSLETMAIVDALPALTIREDQNPA